MQQALDWVLSNEVRFAGDWSKKVKGVEPSGWAFERANQHYPDIDDTAVALIVLSRLPRHMLDTPRIRATIDRALGWTLAMQSSNGGWAAFDKDNDRLMITKIPFCDFGEALDPPSADVTAHVLEALGSLGFDRHHPAVARAYRFLRSEQESDGSWFGRWGVNHVYGTGAVLPALAAIGEDMTQPYVRSAADWLVAHQNADGGWGETCASYMDDTLRGKGPSTASQTGWRARTTSARFVAAWAFSATRSARTVPGTSPTTRAPASRATGSARGSTSATPRRASASRRAPSCSAASC
jgi:squalene-hopene/tetraprenyl-beta-curcumene cyclase